MRRYIESALRMKWRLLISAVLVFVIASAALYMSKQGVYSSSANIWTEKALYLPTDPGSNPYISPAAAQASVFGQLLQTHAFLLEVAQRAKIPMNSAAQEDIVTTDIKRNLHVDAVGANLIRMSYTAAKPTYVQSVISESIAVFVEQMDTSRARQGDVALKVYNDQLKAAEAQMNASKDALDKYARDNPGAGDNGRNDPTYSDLQQQYMADRQRYDDIVTKINDVQTQYQAGSEFITNFFRVQDPPDAATPYVMTLKNLLMNAVIAVILALVAIVGLTLVGTWTDQSVYTLNDISSLHLASAGEDGSELLVGLVPFVPTLGRMRRDLAKREETTKRQAGSRRGPRVTVVPPTDITARPAADTTIVSTDVLADLGPQGRSA